MFAGEGHFFARAYLLAIDFVLPLPMTALMYALWYRRTGSSFFSAYVLLLGIIFGYMLPGLATNVFKLWKFNGPLRIKNYFIHQGFMYAPYLALVLYVAFPAGAPLTFENMIRIVLCAAFVQTVLSCHHDYCGVSIGMIEINNTPAKLRKSPIEIVTEPAVVVGFALLGASFALSCLIAYHWIVVRNTGGAATFVLLLIAGLNIIGASTLPYAILERRHISWAWAARFRKTRSGNDGVRQAVSSKQTAS